MDEYKNNLTIVTMTQCCGILAILLFMNGFMLEYFTALGISNAKVLFLLALPQWGGILFTIHAAYYSDKISKKFIGNIGHICMLISFAIIIILPFLPKSLTYIVAIFAIFLFGSGSSLFGSNWFALLKPLIPKDKSGHFFGIMRASWQSVSILAGLIVSSYLAYSHELFSYQLILFIFWFGLLARFILYQKIPERKVEQNSIKLKEALKSIFYSENFIQFLAYWFLLTMFTCSTANLFVLLGKNILNYTPSNVINMGNSMGFGAVIGAFLGGKLTDKIGTKKVFIICHIGYSIMISSFLCRDFVNINYFLLGLILAFVFGVVSATSGIALTSEFMELLPKKNQSLASAVARLSGLTGFAIMLPIVGIIIDLKFLSEEWILFGKTFTQYDTILLMQSFIILLLIVTLTIVPSVMKKAIWVPVNQGR